jgi:hypothetical protein
MKPTDHCLVTLQKNTTHPIHPRVQGSEGGEAIAQPHNGLLTSLLRQLEGSKLHCEGSEWEKYTTCCLSAYSSAVIPRVALISCPLRPRMKSLLWIQFPVNSCCWSLILILGKLTSNFGFLSFSRQSLTFLPLPSTSHLLLPSALQSLRSMTCSLNSL